MQKKLPFGFRSPREFFISLCHITQEFKMHGDRKISQGNWGKAENEEGTSVIIFLVVVTCCDQLQTSMFHQDCSGDGRQTGLWRLW